MSRDGALDDARADFRPSAISRLVSGGRLLTDLTLKDRLRLATTVLGRSGRHVRRLLVPPHAATRLLPKPWRARPPERLLIAPQDIRTSDPTIAADIEAGYFAFGGRIVNAHGRSPFAEPTTDVGDKAWARQLTGFGWLRHLRAADSPAGRQRGRALVAAFLDALGRPAQGPAWEPAVAARRTLAWLSQSPVILDGADRSFYNRFLLALETHRAVLARQMSGGLRGNDRLLVALALAEFGLCAQGASAALKRASGVLATEIDAQILPDGGPISRNPQAIIDLLLELLPLRQAYAARATAAPQQLLNAIDRMMPMLRMFRHGDGTLALFNGMGVTAPELVATILAYDDARAAPTTNAPYAGYQRIEAGKALLVVDAGASPPRDFSSAAHAGCLSFEFSFGFQRIIVNCGAPDGARTSAVQAARSTAAHSTLVVGDLSSCTFASSRNLERWFGDEILEGPHVVTAERSRPGTSEAPAATQLELAHDGYAASAGYLHRRTLTLADDGRSLEGTDKLEPAVNRQAAATSFALHFHLHPHIKPHLLEGGTVRLDAPDGDAWIFTADTPCVIEPSILFAATGGPRRTQQIRIVANSGTRRQTTWSLRRVPT